METTTNIQKQAQQLQVKPLLFLLLMRAKSSPTASKTTPVMSHDESTHQLLSLVSLRVTCQQFQNSQPPTTTSLLSLLVSRALLHNMVMV